MTNAERNLAIAVWGLENDKIKSQSARSFISDIKDFDKRDLKKLSSKQYSFLSDISKDVAEYLTQKQYAEICGE